MLEKFNISKDATILTEIQKNLSNYEISPHPDIRQKCMTYLININKNEDVSNFKVHTLLMKLKEDKKFVKKYWDENPEVQRCWVPWSWCDIVKEVTQNNTIILFPPNNKSFHGVKMNYPHTEFQRTQIYGNLYYKKGGKFRPSSYKDLEEI